MTQLQERVLALIEQRREYKVVPMEDGSFVLNFWAPGNINPAITKYWQYFRADGSQIYKTAPVAMI